MQLEVLLSGAGTNECVIAECELLKQSQLAQRLVWLVRVVDRLERCRTPVLVRLLREYAHSEEEGEAKRRRERVVRGV